MDKGLKTTNGSHGATKLYRPTSEQDGVRSKWAAWPLGLIVIALTFISMGPSTLLPWSRTSAASSQCPQAAPMHPRLETASLSNMETYLTSDKFRNATIKRLSGAIQVPTVSYDDMGPVSEDARWEVFNDFADFLRQTFPLVHNGAHVSLEKVNSHGLLYTWHGSDPSLKPTILMAHQDVDPVTDSTLDQWQHPPFSGKFDGKSIWGRGALDCKNTLIASLEAVEVLLGTQYKPRRTLILSFGFDEESSGQYGARFLAAYLMKRYGRDGAALIMDEGAPILPVWGHHIAMPGVSEKGYVNVEIIVRTAGGHSSMPPRHTSAGIAAELITIIENTPYSSRLYDENPLLDALRCGAEHAPDFPAGLRLLIPTRGAKGILETAKKAILPWVVSRVSHMVKCLITTTQAVDVVDGGLKINALPERARVLINHRINIGETSDTIKARVTKLATQVAAKHKLTLNAFNGKSEIPESISIKFDGHILEPAPISPTDLHQDGDTPWGVIAGTTRAMYGNKVIIAPGIMTANTDTKYYWDLTRHIFRYFPGWDPEVMSLEGIHTVGERVSVLAHMRTVQWYTHFIRNMDEASMA